MMVEYMDSIALTLQKLLKVVAWITNFGGLEATTENHVFHISSRARNPLQVTFHYSPSAFMPDSREIQD